MKKYLIASLMLASLNAFSQSYLILSNGVTLTTDKSGFIYDFGHFNVPYKVKINGGNFLVASKKLSTIDKNGLLFEKDVEVEEIRGKGLNYFIRDDNRLFTIDENGFVYEYEEDIKVFKKALGFGGNYFTVKPENKKMNVDLYTVNNTGNYFKLKVDGLNPADIASHGGSYFQTKDGVIYTVSKEGFVFPKADMKTGTIKKAGGNFFIDSNNFLYTVSEAGLLMLPILPANIVVADIVKIGANYMIDSSGRIFVVDQNGEMFERTVNHNLSSAKILSR